MWGEVDELAAAGVTEILVLSHSGADIDQDAAAEYIDTNGVGSPY
ncbi:MAG: hypothetical protein ABJ360_02015 [Roseobacter sp.]